MSRFSWAKLGAHIWLIHHLGQGRRRLNEVLNQPRANVVHPWTALRRAQIQDDINDSLMYLELIPQRHCSTDEEPSCLTTNWAGLDWFYYHRAVALQAKAGVAADVTGWVKFIGFILNASANSVRHNWAVVIKRETLTHEPGLRLKWFYDRIIWLNHRSNFLPAHTRCTCWTLWYALRAMWMMLCAQPAVTAYDAGWGACVKKAVLFAS